MVRPCTAGLQMGLHALLHSLMAGALGECCMGNMHSLHFDDSMAMLTLCVWSTRNFGEIPHRACAQLALQDSMATADVVCVNWQELW